MDRRSLLAGLVTLAIAQSACRQNAAQTLRVEALRGVLTPRLLADSEKKLAEDTRLQLTTHKSPISLFKQLETWRDLASETDKPAAQVAADWLCLSDYWLLPAIERQLIRPLGNPEDLPNWSSLPTVWETLLRRDDQGLPTETGDIWATPYRWGHLMMVYSRRHFNRLGWQPSSWEDLLNPDLRGRIAVPEHPRIVLGSVLKLLGKSANSLNPADDTDIQDILKELAPQIKVYASENYLQSLIIGDVWLALGWSTDIRPALSRYRQLAAVSPASGTLLSADVWVKPNLMTQQTSTIRDKSWLSYWWQSDVSTPLSVFSEGLSPLLLNGDARPDLARETVLLPTQEQLENSEFILPLPEVTAYEQLWKTLRGVE